MRGRATALVFSVAESARGFAPRAAHRSGREPLDSSGSCHHREGCRLPSRQEFLRLPVDSIPTWVTCPLRSAGVTLLPRYYETVRPCPADQYFRPHGASACAFSLSTAGRFSSSVPEPGIESRHLCTGHHMASKQVSAMLVPGAEGTLRFRCRLLIRFDALSVVHLRSSLYSSHDVISSRLLTMTFTTAAFGRSSSWLFEACSYKPASKGLPSSPAQHRAHTSAFLTQTLLGFAGGIEIRVRGVGQVHASDQPRSEQERAGLVAAGKELFMARCARCHDERGDKPLKAGPPLNERGLSSEQIARAVSGRLRDKTEEERRAVTLYISSLMKVKDSEEKAPPKP